MDETELTQYAQLNRMLIAFGGSVITALLGAVAVLWVHMKKRQNKDDAYRQAEAERTEKFTVATERMVSAALSMERAMDRNTEVVKDNTDMIRHAFTDPHLPRRKPRT